MKNPKFFPCLHCHQKPPTNGGMLCDDCRAYIDNVLRVQAMRIIEERLMRR